MSQDAGWPEMRRLRRSHHGDRHHTDGPSRTGTSRRVEIGGCRWLGVLLVLVSLLSSVAATEETSSHIVSACFNQPVKTITATCASGYMVRVTQVFYGVSTLGHCGYTAGDCTINDTESVPCMGHRSCSLNLPTGSMGRRIPLCDRYSTYLQVHYTCVEAITVHDICDGGELTAQSGYIMTPQYPLSYPPSRNCSVTLRAAPSQRLRIYIIDMDLDNGGGSCTDLLYLHGQLRSKSLCGQRSREEGFSTTAGISRFDLTFHSDGHNQSKGFWLYYDAFPPLPPTTTIPTTSPAATTTVISTTFSQWPPDGNTGSLQPSSTERPLEPADGRQQISNTLPQPSNLPIEAIVGGVLGTLVFIFVLLLILLILKRRKDRRMPTSTSTCYLHNKPSSPTHGGTLGPYIQNDLHGVPGHSSQYDQPRRSVRELQPFSSV